MTERATEEVLVDVSCLTCEAQLRELTRDVWEAAARDHVTRRPGHVTSLRWTRETRYWGGAE